MIGKAFCVGEYLRDELDARGWSTAECALRMGGDLQCDELTLDLHLAVIDAPPGTFIHQCTMSNATAYGLERALGVSAETWLNLDREYSESIKNAKRC